MTISLIITTYNWKDALELSIRSVWQQTKLPEEVIVADDGSSDGTAELVNKLAEITSLPIVHSWQKDEGFRVAKSRNKAIAKARGDYIILIDGDILLEKHFIEDHLTFAKEGFFIQGSRVIVGEEKTKEILNSKNINLSFFSQNIENRKNCLRSSVLSKLFSRESKKISGIRTCNFAFWKADALAVNGFNEDFIGWGREDSEFVVRLMNKGIRRGNLKFKATAYHLYHPERSRESLTNNDLILRNTIERKLTWCKNGIDQHLNSTTEK